MNSVCCSKYQTDEYEKPVNIPHVYHTIKNNLTFLIVFILGIMLSVRHRDSDRLSAGHSVGFQVSCKAGHQILTRFCR